MYISYDKLWRMTSKRGIKPATIRKAADISPNTFTKLHKNEEVSMSVLMRVADYLKCDISDMCEFVREDKKSSDEDWRYYQ